jgi:hypothetical protein
MELMKTSSYMLKIDNNELYIIYWMNDNQTYHLKLINNNEVFDFNEIKLDEYNIDKEILKLDIDEIDKKILNYAYQKSLQRDVEIVSEWDNGDLRTKGTVNIKTKQLISYESIKTPDDYYNMYQEYIILDDKQYSLYRKSIYDGLENKEDYYWYE